MDFKTYMLISLVSLFSFFNFNEEKLRVVQDDKYSQCLEKSSSSWSSKCDQCQNWTKSYRINLKNVCQDKLDVKVCVQERSMRWRTFNQNNMMPGDTISAYACEGTGKWIFWTKAAGDNTVIFPTDEEIAKEFSPKK